MGPVGPPTASSSKGPPSFTTSDIEMDRTLARLHNFDDQAGELGCCGRREKKSRPTGSPLKKRLANMFKRKVGLRGPQNVLNQPFKQENMKGFEVTAEKTDEMLREAYTIVRAPPRAVLKRHNTSSSNHPRSQTTQQTPGPVRNQRSSPTQMASSARQKPSTGSGTCNDIKYRPESHWFKTPVSRTHKLGNILEFSTVSRSIEFNGTPVAHSRECNITMRSPDGVLSPKEKVKMPTVKPSPRSSMPNMMKNLECQMESRQGKVDDDNESDTTTIHLLSFDELAQNLVCESNEQERIDDPCIPPTLTITTSKLSTTSVLGASTTSFLSDSDFLSYDEDPPTTPAAPIMEETTFSSSIRTLKWSSYSKYYDGPLSPPSLRERWSSASHNKPEAATGDPEMQHTSFLTPPLVSNVSSSSGSSDPSIPSIEVLPGRSVVIRGADETLLYVAADATAEKSLITTNQCMMCTSTFHCVWDAEFTLCPVCRTVQSAPTDDGEQGWGVGLGFLPADWESWKKSLAANGL